MKNPLLPAAPCSLALRTAEPGQRLQRAAGEEPLRLFPSNQRHETTSGGVLVFAMTLADGFAGDPRRPNIVVILADDQSWDDSDFTGQMSVNTPD